MQQALYSFLKIGYVRNLLQIWLTNFFFYFFFLISKRNIIKKAQSAIKYTGSIQERRQEEEENKTRKSLKLNTKGARNAADQEYKE
jgi:hypothetical protein